MNAVLSAVRARLSRVRFSPADVLLFAVAFMLAAVVLLYPFGRDQGLYHYVGREWFRGAVPYRDNMEQKTPLIFFLFGLANTIFGEHYYSIRIVEVLWVLGIGYVVGTLAAPRGEPPVPGVRGASAIVAVISYFGVLNFWNTAQCEIWVVGLSLLSLCLIERRVPSRSFAFWAGVCAGLAVLGKPTAALPGAAIGVILVERSLLVGEGPRVRRVFQNAGLYVAGIFAPIALLLLYLWLNHAIEDTYDVLVRCNAYYLKSEAAVSTTAEIKTRTLEWFRLHKPFSTMVIAIPPVGLVAGIALRSWETMRRYLIAGGLVALATAGVIGQRKFYVYHWGAVLGLVALPFAYAVDDVARRGARLGKRQWIGALVAAIAAVAVLYPFVKSTTEWALKYRTTVELGWKYARGRIPRETWLNGITEPGYDLVGQEVIGHWLEAHTSPDEYVATRNFEPAMYLVAHRRAPTRFFWTPWLAWTSRAYRRREWLAQDAAMLAAHPPRYIVTVGRFHEGVESPDYYMPEYQRVFQHGEAVIMERTGTYFDLQGNGGAIQGRRVRVVETIGAFDHVGEGLPGWQTEGDAMARQPREGPTRYQHEITGQRGSGLVNTYDPERGDGVTGSATSPPFTVRSGTQLMLLVGGGRSPQTGVELLDGEQVVGHWGGNDTEHLSLVTRDLTPFAGHSMRVRIVDQATGAWGHVLADQIVVVEWDPVAAR